MDESVVKRFVCEYCGFAANKKFNLCRHIKLCHLSANHLVRSKIACALCDQSVLNRDDLTTHLSEVHQQTIKTETLKFSSPIEFEAWRKRIEAEHVCRYVRQSGILKRSNGLIIQYLYCHRDGFLRDRSTGSRKSQGSSKMNGACPSKITYKELPSGEVGVTFVSTHLGHCDFVRRLYIPKEDRIKIAEKIKQGIPYDVILQSLREDVSDGPWPNGVINKRDLRNIARDFKLDQPKGHVNDFYSVDLWYKKISAVNNPDASSILFYKKSGEAINDERLQKNDVMLIIANEFQRLMLKKYGGNVVCTDVVHGAKPDDFYAITIMILDQSGTGFPAAYCFTNKKDAKMFSVLYGKLREQVGQLRTEIFISGDEESSYDGWKSVMGPVPYRLLCPWIIDTSWRQNLISKVTNPQKRAIMYKTLNDLLQEPDTRIFDTLLTNFLRQIMNDPETQSFGSYFSTFYAFRPAFWAYSHIQSCGLDSDLPLDAVHKVVNSYYIHAKRSFRLATCLDSLMRYTRDTSCLSQGKKPKPQRTAHKKEIMIAHEKAQQTDWNQHFEYVDEVIPNMWYVRSHTNEEIKYAVELLLEQPQVCSSSCSSTCEQCIPKICVHTFSCECTDYVMRRNICKHIHALVIFPNVPKEISVIQCDSTFQDDDIILDEAVVEIECDVSPTLETSGLKESGTYDLPAVENKLEQVVGYLKSNPDCTSEETSRLSQLADEMLNILHYRAKTK
ncbi:uncharacterized protein LOC135836259 [Planococcus citri]|uniref:uncharacterized protein LOC135836259 n=1 Tax=Planococcus citri TaxID=170843 RepID=UPI0031F79AA0